ncbi:MULTISPECIES: hypothetical protein [unclassified Streptomyces]|uniref:hypothetical protein n=1 Tax=unclassified Streptomyces TaxID=2593676 RepID=UPI0022528D9A|nr:MULTISPECIES: hypothetical protein [unclassified Streptomyces]MCX4629623.1 hypothetical protein [Streptomyces sp. NBC_01443]
MAEEKAPGGLAGLTGMNAGLADAIRAQAKALEVEFESMTNYKKLVDDLLKKLDGSGADEKKLAHVTLPDGALGKGFAEADALFKTYTTVHSQLQNLSKGLAGQIEALGIAIMTAGKGYGGVDEDTQARMRSIVAQAKKDYVPERDPLAKEKNTQHATPDEGNKGKVKY